MRRLVGGTCSHSQFHGTAAAGTYELTAQRQSATITGEASLLLGMSRRGNGAAQRVLLAPMPNDS